MKTYLRFKLADESTFLNNPFNRKVYEVWEIIDNEKCKSIATFDDPNLAGDVVNFLNDKYCDRDINAEWFLDEKKRIAYHLDQLRILTLKDKCKFNEHGNGVE